MTDRTASRKSCRKFQLTEKSRNFHNAVSSNGKNVCIIADNQQKSSDEHNLLPLALAAVANWADTEGRQIINGLKKKIEHKTTELVDAAVSEERKQQLLVEICTLENDIHRVRFIAPLSLLFHKEDLVETELDKLNSALEAHRETLDGLKAELADTATAEDRKRVLVQEIEYSEREAEVLDRICNGFLSLLWGVDG